MNSPSIGIGSVRHTRTRPASHRLSVPAFFLRLPLRALSARRWPFRWLARNRAGLFALNDADHGDGRPLLEWIEALLAQGDVRDVDGEIWLHTFPRLLGYVFNPVSFWFAHRADGSLRAVVCEVNNTFGERHCYLLAHPDGRALTWGQELTAAKVFHVSPFCEIRGEYRFRFMLNAAGDRFVARIDYHDVPGQAALLNTSIEGRLAPLTDARLLTVAARRPLFTFGVIARIHLHALRLWLKGVPFFRKPAPPPALPAPAQTSSLRT
jgi:DUF1365 family protein